MNRLEEVRKDHRFLHRYGVSNRLEEVVNAAGQAARYEYDGLGNRTGVMEYAAERKRYSFGEEIPEPSKYPENPKKTVNFILDLTRPYRNLLAKEEITGGRTEKQNYTWDSNTVFAAVGETVHTCLQDELGSTVRLVGGQENRQAVYGYDEFGQDLYGTQGLVQPFGYTGYQKDRIADTYFAQAREYLPGVGRFGGEDWIKGSITAPLTLNRYGYCQDNPINKIDLDGKHSRNAGPSADDIAAWYFRALYEAAERAWKEAWTTAKETLNDVVDVTVESGYGVGASFGIFGMEPKVVAKMYNEWDLFSNETQWNQPAKLDMAAEFDVANNISFGAGMKSDNILEDYEDWYVGANVKKVKMQRKEDMKISLLSGSFYWGPGVGYDISINVDAILRRIGCSSTQ